ncbi:MAG: molybdopterin-dependent oxidoreductase [Planctomycetes bacterium]|nr:molybdopterin-dependent oxidoreductase [Planctomycetota bacterium]
MNPTNWNRDPKNSVGKPRRRVDARARVTGQVRFADDLSLPRMLHCRLVRSHVPHAKILGIDASKALARKGVKLVLTGEHFPIAYGVLPVSHDEHPLCNDKVRFVGDPVAAVIATTEEEAIDAANDVVVHYESLTTIATPQEALATPEPRIHTYGDSGNVHKKVHFEFGDVDASFAGAAHVFDDTFFYEGNTHLPIEEHASLAIQDPEGKLCIWSSTQTPHYLHKALAKALAMDPAHIRVIATPNGGGFGGKSDPFNHEIVVAKAALMLGRPVKICLTRLEVFYCHRGRHPIEMRMRTATDKDGNVLALDLQTLLDGGSYGSYGVASTFYSGALQTVTYTIPRYRFRGCRAFTNKPPCGPKRGHGTPQPRFAQEVQLDRIAVKLGKNPAALRLQQLAQPGSLTANFMRIGTIGLGACIDKVVEGSRFRERWGKLPFGRGLGLACSSYLCGAGLAINWAELPHSGVQLRLDRSGEVTAFCGATEIGQGSDDVLANIVAEILGIPPFDVRVVTGDTGLTPVDLGSYSSRVTLMMGNAAIQAAERARDLIAKSAGEKLGVPASRLVFANKRVFDAQDPNVGMTWLEALHRAESDHGTLGTVGSYRPAAPAAKYKGGGVGPSPTYSYSAAVIETQVDPDTGWIHVEHVWVAHDIGRSLNPTLVEGQVIGSVYMGLGEALMEEQVFRRLPPRLSNALVHKIPSILEYKSLTSKDMPDVTTYLIEDPDSAGPFGAKEVGQGPLLPMMPALANSVFDAVGVRVDEIPVTPEKVIRALEAKSKRYGPDEFPTVDWPEPLKVAPPWEGGDGTAQNEKPRKSKIAKDGTRIVTP